MKSKAKCFKVGDVVRLNPSHTWVTGYCKSVATYGCIAYPGITGDVVDVLDHGHTFTIYVRWKNCQCNQVEYGDKGLKACEGYVNPDENCWLIAAKHSSYYEYDDGERFSLLMRNL